MAAHSSIGWPANNLFAWAPTQSRRLLLRPSQTDSRTRISCFDFQAHRSGDLLRFLRSTDLVLGSPPLPPLTTANNHQLPPLSAPTASVATANHEHWEVGEIGIHASCIYVKRLGENEEHLCSVISDIKHQRFGTFGNRSGYTIVLHRGPSCSPVKFRLYNQGW